MRIPLLRIDEFLLTSLQNDITDDELLDFQTNLLRTITDYDVRGVCIDISTLDIIDFFIARVINETSQMARLMGAEVVICGMQPAVAITLIDMGQKFLNVQTKLNLSKGLEFLKLSVEQKTKQQEKIQPVPQNNEQITPHFDKINEK